MANSGLSVDDVVGVEINLDTVAAQERNFGNLLILGDSDIIDSFERLRLYTSSDDIEADFGSQAPEFLAAELYFGQSPQPAECYIGRWASTATHGLLRGSVLGATQQAVSNFTTVSNGGLNITVDGVAHAITGIDLSGQSNLNGVAASLQTALAGVATVRWDSNNGRFIIESSTSGSLSTVAFATPPGSGTDISGLLGLNNQDGGYSLGGMAAETITSAVALLADQSTDWYGLQIASTATPSDSDYVLVATFIQSANPSRIFGATTQEPAVLDPTVSSDLSSLFKAGGFRRAFSQYSSAAPFATASIFGRAFTVDFDGVNTTITLNMKQEPSVPPELISESQKKALAGKFCNAFLKFNNDTTILQQGWMASGDWFDAIHGADWLQNAIQTAVFNVFLTTGTKIPQTDAGLTQLVTAVSQSCQKGVTNGLLFPGGIWTGPAVGTINTGDTLPQGYYVFAPKVSTQSQADRQVRKTPLIQAAVKFSGAFHSANILVSVNQ